MLIIDLLLFGAVGATIWAMQMVWIPSPRPASSMAFGHYWGYRNFEARGCLDQRRPGAR